MEAHRPDDFGAQLDRLFHHASDLPPEERKRFLETECVDDQALREQVERLLLASQRAEANSAWDSALPFTELAAGDQLETQAPGSRLDRYEVRERIGTGGMGIVYKAVRADDAYSQVVAVKILLQQPDDDQAAARFRSERQILAHLEHPNIARLLDGGETAAGQSFLVMEYVEGDRIDRYVKERGLSLREILLLFRKLCSAISCAHTNLVVHRDLKPSNVLVTAGGEPKLLDFGIAKLLDGSAPRTATGAAALTPEFASPEQLRGEQVTAASDIYSLGVLLYLLLSGELPYADTTNAVALARAVCDEAPRALRVGDSEIENLVQMALRKEPSRRYASVEQFSEDIRRYLEGYPILAQPDRPIYRARKFLGRNRIPILAVALVVLTLMGGIITTARQARIAEKRFGDVRKLANSYLFEVHDAIKDLSGSTPARRLVVKRALEYLDALAGERSNDPGLQRELASAYFQVALIQGMPNASSLGDRKGALENFRKSLALRDRLAAQAPKDVEIGRELAECYYVICQLQTVAGDLKGAVESAHRSLDSTEKLLKVQPANVKLRRHQAASAAILGEVLGNPNVPNLGDTKGALVYLHQATDILEQLVAENPDSNDDALLLETRYYQIAQIEQSLNDPDATLANFKKSLAIIERLVERFPDSAVYARSAAMGNRSIALAYAQLLNNYVEPKKYSARSAQLFERLAQRDPDDVEAQIMLADSIWGQAYVLPAGSWKQSLAYYDRAIAIYEKIKREHPSVNPMSARTAYQFRGNTLIELRRFPEALRDLDRVNAINAQLLEVNPQNVSAIRSESVIDGYRGNLHEKLARRSGTPDRRKTEWREALGWFVKQHDLLAAQQKAGSLPPLYVRQLDSAQAGIDRCNQALRQ
jgi:serine/threonine protein kinase/tetratricopeptide (TPR) repeat protein